MPRQMCRALKPHLPKTAVSFLRAAFLFPSRVRGIFVSSRGLAILARCARRSPRGASGWQRCRGSDGDAIPSRLARLSWQRPCRGHAGSWGSKGGQDKGVKEIPRDSSRSANAFSGSRQVLWRMGRCVLPNLSAKMHIAVLPGRGRADAPGPGPTAGIYQEIWVTDSAWLSGAGIGVNCTRNRFSGHFQCSTKEAYCHVTTILSCVANSVAHLFCATRDWRAVDDFQQPRRCSPLIPTPSRDRGFDFAPLPSEGDGWNSAHGQRDAVSCLPRSGA